MTDNHPGKYKVIISDAALGQLDGHALFWAKVSTDASEKMVRQVMSDIKSLSENPERFPIYESQFITGVKYHRMLTAKRYLALYEIKKDMVLVDYIVDCRQDYEWLITLSSPPD